MFLNNSFEKKLLAVTIGSAAIVVAKKPEEKNGESSKKNLFVPDRLQENNVAADSITRDEVQLSLHLDNPNGEKVSPILLKNKASDVGEIHAGLRSGVPTIDSAKNRANTDIGILPSRIHRRLNPKSTKSPKASNIFSPTAKSSKKSVLIPATANMTELVPCAIEINYSTPYESCDDGLVYGPMIDWDVSEVTSFFRAFQIACKGLGEDINWPAVNKIIEKWDTSGATDFDSIFSQCTFGENAPDLSKWDVSNVIDMGFAFFGSDFNDDGVVKWTPKSVNNTEGMFEKNRYFNHDLSSWASHLQEDVYMGYMLRGAKSFNQCLASWAARSPGLNDYTFSNTDCPNKWKGKQDYFCCETVPAP